MSEKRPPLPHAEVIVVPHIPVGLPDPVISEEEVLLAIKRQGDVTVSKTAITDLANIGAHLMGAGTLKVQRGMVVVSQQRVNRVMILLTTELERLALLKSKDKTARMTQVAQAIGYLTARLTDAQSLMVAIERIQHPAGSPLDELNPGATACFGPSENVQPSQTTVFAKEVHLHQNGQPPSSPPAPPEKTLLPSIP